MSNEVESNSTTSTANALTLGSAIKGQLSSSSDVDYYKFTASSAGAVSIALDVPTNSSFSDYFSFTLYDSSNNELGSYSTGQDLTASLGVSTAGTYYIKVAVPSYYHDAGQYSLTASLVSTSELSREKEPNDVYPNILSSGLPISGSLSDANDIDTFSIATTGPGGLTIAFESPTASSNSNYY